LERACHCARGIFIYFDPLVLKPQILKYYFSIKIISLNSLRMNSSHGQTHAVDMSQDWQTSKTTSAERAKHLLMTGLFADCQFLVGANGSDQEV